ncbi:MAG: DUF2256 domain-containing protein, partial [Synechococcaceae cyanobacterium]
DSLAPAPPAPVPPGMPHHADRPTKFCACCGRPFQWRRKWKQVWDEVRYCSERCRNQARRPASRRREGPAVGSG